MTSKETLNKIYDQAYIGLENDAPELIYLLDRWKQRLEKELEVLDIFKELCPRRRLSATGTSVACRHGTSRISRPERAARA